ncbi:MAG: hypothetical protein ACRDPI_04655 [Nocardioidaceae bacterium]
MFKSAEEREAEKQQREAEQAQETSARDDRRRAAAQERARQELLSTPLGAATAAKQDGERFLEIQLQVGTHSGSASFGSVDSSRAVQSSAAVLAQIEQLGWHLEHATYFFMLTGETSTQRVFLSGEATAINGVTMGAYLFRNSDASAGPAALSAG